jgi:uncharacterized protein (TIGR03435 family)
MGNSINTILIACVICSTLASAQIPGERPVPEFEVASVKSAQGSFNCREALIGARFTCFGIALKPLLMIAYGITERLLSGGPAWLDTDKFDIEAKAPAGVGNDQFKAMLQNLLAQRFGLAVRWEEREMPVYELVVASGGPKLKPREKVSDGPEVDAVATALGGVRLPKMTTNRDGYPEFPPNSPILFATRVKGANWVTARMKSIGDLLNFIYVQMDRPVVDKTGLTGVYDFTLRYAILTASNVGAPGDALSDAAPDPAPTIFDAFEAQLGLKLQPKKEAVKVLVVDRVSRTPTEN